MLNFFSGRWNISRISILSKFSLPEWLVFLLAFFVPISTSLTTVCMMIILLFWLFAPNLKQRVDFYFRNPLTPYIWVLMSLIFIGLFYTSAELDESFGATKDAIRLGFIPILMFYLQKDEQKYAVLYAFVTAMVVTLFFAFLKVYAGFPIGEKYTVGAVFKSHIKTSFFMAISAFILVYYAYLNPRARWWAALLGLLMIYYLFFMSIGRIGHLTLCVMGVVFAWRTWGPKGIVIALLGITALLIVAYQTSTVFSNRIDLLKQDWAFYQEGGRLLESSLGSRIQFAKSSIEIFKQHPIIGLGTGSYANAYEKIHEGEKILLTVNPHNEYFRMMVELGILGLITLLALFAKQWQLTYELSTVRCLMSQACLLSFYVGCFLNSWLGDFTEAYFYCLLSAVAFSTCQTKTLPIRLIALRSKA